MSIQDDHFDTLSHFEELVKSTKKGTPERKKAEGLRKAYCRIWTAFVDEENENEKLRPIANAASTIVQYVIDTHYSPKEG